MEHWLAKHPEEVKGQLHKPKDGVAENHLFVTEDGRVLRGHMGRITI